MISVTKLGLCLWNVVTACSSNSKPLLNTDTRYSACVSQLLSLCNVQVTRCGTFGFSLPDLVLFSHSSPSINLCKPMESNVLTAVFLPLALAFIMMGMGLSLRPDDFRRKASRERNRRRAAAQAARQAPAAPPPTLSLTSPAATLPCPSASRPSARSSPS